MMRHNIVHEGDYSKNATKVQASTLGLFLIVCTKFSEIAKISTQSAHVMLHKISHAKLTHCSDATN